MNESSTQNNKDFRAFVCQSLREQSVAISDEWLAALKDVVNEESRDIFPTEQYLDHIPSMIDEIANIIGDRDADLGMVNSLIERKAIQLGTLRHQQKASVTQLLREYDLLANILEDFLTAKSAEYSHGDLAEGIDCMAAIARVVRSILQSTVDTFVEKYMSTIQQQTEKLVSFNQFLSHELKTPLQAALLNTELLLENRDLTTADAKELVTIAASIRQAASLLQNMENLALNTTTSLEDSPVVQEVDLSALLRDIQAQLDVTLASRDVHVTIQENMGMVTAETAKLKLIFTNILTNSLKYCDPSKSQRTVTVSTAPADEKLVCIEVSDNGLGIDKPMQDKVFQMRVRAHESEDSRHDVSGYGLGLYLVEEAVKDIGGTVALESEPGAGTTVKVIFPRTASSNHQPG